MAAFEHIWTQRVDDRHIRNVRTLQRELKCYTKPQASTYISRDTEREVDDRLHRLNFVTDAALC